MVVPEDFMRPTGRLDDAWIDEDAIQALITEAEAASSSPAAQRAFVYAHAYSRIADDQALLAASRTADDISETYSPAQIAHWARQAAAWHSAFNSITGASGTRPVKAVW